MFVGLVGSLIRTRKFEVLHDLRLDLGEWSGRMATDRRGWRVEGSFGCRIERGGRKPMAGCVDYLISSAVHVIAMTKAVQPWLVCLPTGHERLIIRRTSFGRVSGKEYQGRHREWALLSASTLSRREGA